MGRLWRVCLIVIFAFPALGQDSRLKVAVPLIAFGAHHRATSISLQSLVITDQKVPVTAADLLPGTDFPLELGVLIDTSSSRRGSNFGETLKAVDQFMREAIQGPEDRVFLLTFDITSHVTDWLNKEQLRNTNVQVGGGGGTAVYDALAIACQKRLGPRDWTKPTRRILLLVSDGDDNQSHLTRGEAVSEALKSGAVIFTIDTSQTGVLTAGDKIMEEFAKQTGGESFDNIGGRDIPKVFASIQELINGMYYLRYLPPSTPDRVLHEIEMKPAPKEKLKLSYAKKYFWNP